jgi:hypothetical protein
MTMGAHGTAIGMNVQMVTLTLLAIAVVQLKQPGVSIAENWWAAQVIGFYKAIPNHQQSLGSLISIIKNEVNYQVQYV